MATKKDNDPKDPEKEALVEKVSQEKAPGKFDVQVEDYEADQSTKPGPEIRTKGPPKSTDNEFGVDLSHLTPSARERTLAEMREGAKRVGALKSEK